MAKAKEYSRKLKKYSKMLTETVMMTVCFSQGIIIPTKVSK